MTKEYIASLNNFAAKLTPSAIPTSTSSAPEVDTLAANVVGRHGESVTTAACLLQLSSSLLRHFGKQNSANLEPLVMVLHDAVEQWVENRGGSVGDLAAALNSLQVCGETAHQLHLIPD